MASPPEAPGPRLLLVHDLGLVPYDEAYAYQREVAQRRIRGELDQDVLVLCAHPPVVTLGRSTKPGHLLASPEQLAALGIALRDIERGGDVTVHEPGQLVAYPIIDLKRHTRDLHWYLRQLEQAVIDAVAEVGLESGRRPGLTGVWCGSDDSGWRKLASIGVHARDWVTWHGLALNVTNDLATFGHVVPCGIGGVAMTSVARELAGAPSSDAGVTAAGLHTNVTATGLHAGVTATGLDAAVRRAVALGVARAFGLSLAEPLRAT
jgi:lipoyl(octanoyl) transferase